MRLKFNSFIFLCLLLLIIILSILDYVDSRRGGGFRGGGGMRGGGGFRGGGMRGGGMRRPSGGGFRGGGVRHGGFRGGGMRPSSGSRPGFQRGNNFNRRPMNNFRPQQSLNRSPTTNNFKPQMQRQRQNNFNQRPQQFQRQRPSTFGQRRPSQNQIKRPINTQRKPLNSRPGPQRQNIQNRNRQPQSQRINPLTQRNRPQQSRPRVNPSSRQPQSQQNRRIIPSRTRPSPSRNMNRPMNSANRKTPSRTMTQKRPVGSTNKRIFNPVQKRIQSQNQNKNVRKPVQTKPVQNRVKTPIRNRVPSKPIQNKRPTNSFKKPIRTKTPSRPIQNKRPPTNSYKKPIRTKTPISRTRPKSSTSRNRISNRKNPINGLSNKPKPTNNLGRKKIIGNKNMNQKYKKKLALDLDDISVDSIPISSILSSDLVQSPVIVQQDPAIIINDPPVIVQNQPPIVINEGPQVIYDSQQSPIYYDSDQQINLPNAHQLPISCPTPLIVENERIRVSCRFQGSGETLKGHICLSQNSYEDSSVLFFNCKRPYENSNSDDYSDDNFNIKTCHKGDWIGEINLDCKLPPAGGGSGENLIFNMPNENHLVQNNNQIPNNFQNPNTFVDPQSQINGQSQMSALSKAEADVTTKKEDLNTPINGKCQILKPTRSLGVLLECVSGGNNTEISINSCQVPSIVGTEAKFKCSNYYQVIEGLGTPLRKCKEPGIWSGTSDFSCTVACGMANSVKTPFITSGLPTIRGQWPWHAALFGKISKKSEEWVYMCGGTLIGRSAIITAAHCVTKFDSVEVQNIADLRIDLGRYEIEIDEDEPGKGLDANVQQMAIRDIYVHPSYTPFGFDSDISIIILEKEIEISYFVRPICIPQISESTLEELQLSEGSVGTVVGWGLNENSSLSSDLKMGHLSVKSPKECTHAVKAASSGSIQSRSTTFCAGSKNQTIVCNGDSGGGMYFPSKNLENTRWYLQGVVSVGIADASGKCDPNQVSVFTRVGRYAEWIVRTLVEADIYS